MKKFVAAIVLIGIVSGCADEGGVPGYNALEDHVQGTRVGRNADHWIEMKNAFGEWERTGLIFGYADDYDECTKAIAGLKDANPGREYRCAPAN